MPTYHVVIDFEFEANSPEEAARRMFEEIDDTPFDPVVEVRDEANINVLGEFEYSEVMPPID